MPCACTVPTMSDVVDAIQVLLIFFIVHVLTPGSDNLDGVMAEENLAGWTRNKRQNGNFYFNTIGCINTMSSPVTKDK